MKIAHTDLLLNANKQLSTFCSYSMKETKKLLQTKKCLLLSKYCCYYKPASIHWQLMWVKKQTETFLIWYCVRDQHTITQMDNINEMKHTAKNICVYWICARRWLHSSLLLYVARAVALIRAADNSSITLHEQFFFLIRDVTSQQTRGVRVRFKLSLEHVDPLFATLIRRNIH